MIQAITSSAARQAERAEVDFSLARDGGEGEGEGDGNGDGNGDGGSGDNGLSWLTNTCHLWAEDGIGLQKVASGWRPGKAEYPAPSLVEILRRMGSP